ncbi:MAG: hypothetical protein WAV09_02005 [Minisyncoccia bacterium]
MNPKEKLVQEIAALTQEISVLEAERDRWQRDENPWNADDVKVEISIKEEWLFDLLADALDLGMDSEEYPIVRKGLEKYDVRRLLRGGHCGGGCH